MGRWPRPRLYFDRGQNWEESNTPSYIYQKKLRCGGRPSGVPVGLARFAARGSSLGFAGVATGARLPSWRRTRQTLKKSRIAQVNTNCLLADCVVDMVGHSHHQSTSDAPPTTRCTECVWLPSSYKKNFHGTFSTGSACGAPLSNRCKGLDQHKGRHSAHRTAAFRQSMAWKASRNRAQVLERTSSVSHELPDELCRMGSDRPLLLCIINRRTLRTRPDWQRRRQWITAGLCRHSNRLLPMSEDYRQTWPNCGRNPWPRDCWMQRMATCWLRCALLCVGACAHLALRRARVQASARFFVAWPLWNGWRACLPGPLRGARAWDTGNQCHWEPIPSPRSSLPPKRSIQLQPIGKCRLSMPDVTQQSYPWALAPSWSAEASLGGTLTSIIADGYPAKTTHRRTPVPRGVNRRSTRRTRPCAAWKGPCAGRSGPC